MSIPPGQTSFIKIYDRKVFNYLQFYLPKNSHTIATDPFKTIVFFDWVVVISSKPGQNSTYRSSK